MAMKFGDEVELDQLAATLLHSRNGEASLELLSNEAALHALFENLRSGSITINKISFSIIVMLLDHWKRSDHPRELPSIIYTYIEVIDQFIYFSTLGKDSAKDSFASASKVLKEPSNPEPVLYFLPQKFFPERRLYRVTREDMGRIVREKAWSKFPDPHKCENWIKLPHWYDRLEIGSKATLRMSVAHENSVSRGGTESLSSKENVAQMIFQLRTARKRHRTGAALERGSSIFKPKIDNKGVSPTSRKASSQGFPEFEEIDSPLIIPGMKMSTKLEMIGSPDSTPPIFETPRKELESQKEDSLPFRSSTRELQDYNNMSHLEMASDRAGFAIYEAGSTQEVSYLSKPESLFESLSGSGHGFEGVVASLGVSKHVRRYTLNLPRSKFIPK